MRTSNIIPTVLMVFTFGFYGCTTIKPTYSENAISPTSNSGENGYHSWQNFYGSGFINEPISKYSEHRADQNIYKLLQFYRQYPDLQKLHYHVYTLLEGGNIDASYHRSRIQQLSKSANINYPIRGYRNYTPFQLAAINRNKEAAQYFIELGADPSLKYQDVDNNMELEGYPKSFIYFAYFHQRQDIIPWLIEVGAGSEKDLAFAQKEAKRSEAMANAFFGVMGALNDGNSGETHCNKCDDTGYMPHNVYGQVRCTYCNR